MIRGKKIGSVVLAGILSFSLTVPVQATTIDEAQQKANELEQQKKATEGEKASLSEQLNTILTNMQKTQSDIDTKSGEIEQAENDLIQAKVEENLQYENMKKRIQYMYEGGNSQFITILLESKTITDFLNKAEYITQLSTYDRDMLTTFQKAVEAVEKKEAALKEDYTKLQKLQESLTSQQASVQTLLDGKSAQLADIQAEIGENAALLQELKDKAVAAEKARKEAAAGGSSNSGSSSGGSYVPPGPSIPGNASGMFINPCPGAHVSSEYGEYRSPSDPAHKGMDFGTSGQYLPTYAAAAGKVLIAGWSNSAGNWVVIDHGKGIVTKYMHHSALSVSAGQTVSQGQQIGVTGNTGQSFGIHLHFQVEVSGRAVNPRNYL